MENPIKMDDLGGFPPIFGNTHMVYLIGVVYYSTVTSNIAMHALTTKTCRWHVSGRRTIKNKPRWLEIWKSTFNRKTHSTTPNKNPAPATS